MKPTFITILSFLLSLAACSSEKKLLDEQQVTIISATYNHWSELPAPGSDVPERGTDLELFVKNWPSETSPDKIIFQGMESFPAEITDSTESGVVIFGRIIRSSVVLEETSDRVDLSDRLVFIAADGKTYHIEIEEWRRMENDES